MIEYIKKLIGKGSGGGKVQDTPNNSNVNKYIIRTNEGDVTARVDGGEIYLESNELKKDDVEKVAEILGAVLTEYHKADIIKKEQIDKAKTYKKMSPQERMNELMKDLNEENSPFSHYKNYENNESTENTKKNEHVGYMLLESGNKVVITPKDGPLLTADDLKSAVTDLNSGVYSGELPERIQEIYGKYFHKIPTTDKKSQ